MFKTMKQLFTPSNKDLRHRIYFTFFALAIFIIGCSIRVPGTNAVSNNLDFLELLNSMGGGAFKRFSIFALGVMPYITASIIMQLLEMDIFPYFADLAKQGHTGRQKLNQITRYMGIVFAFIEGYAFSFAFYGKSGNPLDYLYISVILTAGTAFLLWLGDQITEKGIGNGISLIIMAGIIATLPEMFVTAFQSLVTFGGAQQTVFGILKFVIFVLIYIAILVGIIFIQESERRIPIQYANKSTNSYSQSQSYVPIKINSANVMPVIFASSLLSIPSILAVVIRKESFSLFVQKYISYTTPTGFILYTVLIFLFSYFYTFIQMRPDEFSKNLQENGGYIPGVRPGKETEKYLGTILSRITVLGAAFLTVIAGLPILFSAVSSLPTSVSIGGTGILIVVGVALETYRQLEGSLLARNYKKGYSRR
ncbi:MAG: preprotein translocase subunit SecY [Bacilli bacterium]|nr:preprotein translocase subunit SecY [Bacilli bacterium]